MRAAFWASCAALLVVGVVGWLTLPDRVPLHFGGTGAPDRWGSRNEAVLTTALLGGGLVLLFWALARWLPRAPASLINLPEADKRWWLATEERTTELRRRLTDDLYLIGAATVLLIVAVEVMTLTISNDPEPRTPFWFWVIVGGYLVGVIGWTVWAIARRYRTPRDL
ncbi:DUF1648 domain-containing protein [Nocardioides sp. Bht2]|uniref:DUF1648 domain-containing protein n=1 Tax=Nocardioides sp. Bht2 TaxID=3392297 RepID=UPI0039B4E191